ncbi:hypothetical protein IF2G_02439 [Cordyceps javanica]|nr:hypothetical protein IF2G_02439 [Cordyceps javanica]
MEMDELPHQQTLVIGNSVPAVPEQVSLLQAVKSIRDKLFAPLYHRRPMRFPGSAVETLSEDNDLADGVAHGNGDGAPVRRLVSVSDDSSEVQGLNEAYRLPAVVISGICRFTARTAFCHGKNDGRRGGEMLGEAPGVP